MAGDPVATILNVGLRHAVTAPNAEAAVEAVSAIAGEPIDPLAFHAAVADCIARGLIHDPITLPEGSLQCHWRLRLTPDGLLAARALRESS